MLRTTISKNQPSNKKSGELLPDFQRVNPFKKIHTKVYPILGYCLFSDSEDWLDLELTHLVADRLAMDELKLSLNN